MSGPPVVVVTSNGRPVVNVASNAPPMVVVESNGEPVVVVESNASPVTLLNPDGTLWSAETDLERLIALSPSLLIWPANGAGWQGTSGGTLAASGQPLGLGADLSQLQGKTLSEWLATAAEVSRGAWVQVAATASITDESVALSGGGGFAAAGRTLTGLTSGRCYYAEITISGLTGGNASLDYRNNATPGNGSRVFAQGITANGTARLVFRAEAGNNIEIRGDGATALTASGLSIKELPGNHLRAGTWASPSVAARGTLQVSGGVTWIDPDATSDAYSFLTALSARAIVARVRVPTGYSNADRFLTNDAETVNVSADAGNWTNTGGGSTRVNGASGAAFTVDTWHTLTIEWGSGQAFSSMWFSATGTLFGSMDVASLAVFNSALSTGDRATAESVIGATA